MLSLKRLFLFIILLLVNHCIQAQVLMSLIFGDKLNTEQNAFGIHIDYSFNGITNLEESKAIGLGSLNLGLFFSRKFDDHWAWNMDLLGKYIRGASGIPAYSLMDPDLDTQFSGTHLDRKINYLSALPTIRYLNDKGMFVEAGAQFSWRTKKAKDYFEISVPDGDLLLEVDIRDQINQIDVSYVVGVGALIGKYKVDAVGIRYVGGIVNVMKNQGSNKHSQLAIYYNLPIGRGKAGLKD